MHCTTIAVMAAAISAAVAAPGALPPVGDEPPHQTTTSTWDPKATPVDPVWSISQYPTRTLEIPFVAHIPTTLTAIVSTTDEHNEPTMTTHTTVVTTDKWVTRMIKFSGPPAVIETPTTSHKPSPRPVSGTVTKTFTVRDARLPSTMVFKGDIAGNDEAAGIESAEARKKESHQSSQGHPSASCLPAGLGKPRVCHH